MIAFDVIAVAEIIQSLEAESKAEAEAEATAFETAALARLRRSLKICKWNVAWPQYVPTRQGLDDFEGFPIGSGACHLFSVASEGR